MKVINRARAGGKTTQLLYLSDFHQWPIICFNKEMTNTLVHTAEGLGLKIPRPIAIDSILNSRICGYDGYLMDESVYCIQELFNRILGKDKLKAITMTEPYINKKWDGREEEEDELYSKDIWPR